MAKKIVEPIIGTGKDPENQLVVQKSIPLFSLWQSDMSLAEFKILDTYLSRINSRVPDKRTVVFTKGELEQLLGVKKINKPQLAARLKSLGRFVDIEDGNSHKVHQVALFEEAYGELDDNGQWTVKLTCTQKAMKYVFNIEKIGYLRYRLHSIISLKSRYAYILFLFLEHNRYRKSWEVDVDTLRQQLNCTEKLYDEFKYFNQRVLQRSQTEIHKKTDCRFDYEPIKKGKCVSKIRFTVHTLTEALLMDSDEDKDQISIFEYSKDAEDPNAIYAEVLPDGLTAEEVESLRAEAAQHVPYDPFDVLPFSVRVANYLALKVKIMNATNPKVKNSYRYLLTMIANDE